jgi:hypothetical protein
MTGVDDRGRRPQKVRRDARRIARGEAVHNLGRPAQGPASQDAGHSGCWMVGVRTYIRQDWGESTDNDQDPIQGQGR